MRSLGTLLLAFVLSVVVAGAVQNRLAVAFGAQEEFILAMVLLVVMTVVTTLAMAWSHLTRIQQDAVKSYVRAELQDERRAPWSSKGFIPPEGGARRELHTVGRTVTGGRQRGPALRADEHRAQHNALSGRRPRLSRRRTATRATP